MLASWRVMGMLRLALARQKVAAAVAAAHAVMIWGRMVVSIFSLLLCSCVLHSYNMSTLRHISRYNISHRTI